MNLGIQATGVATGLLLARLLGPEGRGRVAGATIWATTVASLMSFGTIEATAHLVAADGQRRDEWIVAARRVSGWLSGLSLPIAVLAGVALAKPAVRAQAIEYSVYAPIAIMTGWAMGGLLGQRRYDAYNGIRGCLSVCNLIGLILLAVSGTLTASAVIYVYITAAIITLAYAAFSLPVGKKGGSTPAMRRQVLGYGIRSHAGSVTSQMNEQGDQLLIAALLAPRLLGLYVVGVAVTGPIIAFGSAINSVALAEFSAEGASAAALRGLWRRTVSISLGAAAGMYLIAVVFLKPVVGNSFGQVLQFLPLLLLAAVVLSGNRVLQAGLRALGRPGRVGLSEAIALGATALCLLALLPSWRLQGAALASLLGYAVSGACMLAFIGHRVEK